MKNCLLKTTLLVLVLSAFTFILTCSSESTPTGQGYKFIDPAIWGYVYDNSHVPIEGAHVEWYCDTCDEFLDDDYTNSTGYYSVGGDQFEDHDGDDLDGFAFYGAGMDKVNLDDYVAARVYHIDFVI